MTDSPRFRDLPEFGPTIDAAAERLGISATAVEKDYWVSEVLSALESEFAGDFILKEGTSLSKGYGLIERFSEDIDGARASWRPRPRCNRQADESYVRRRSGRHRRHRDFCRRCRNGPASFLRDRLPGSP